MKTLALYIILSALLFVSACEVQSGITKKNLEKYMPTPTPERKVEPVEQIDPSDIVNVDVSQQGPPISINRTPAIKSVDCKKYNNVTVNVSEREITVKGVCKQIMINGDKNEITASALSEIVLNGHENSLQYSKFANGKKPFVTDNGNANVIEKTAPPAVKR